MWDSANLVLVSANDRIGYSDHMAWSWMSGLHGLFWPLMVVLVAAILVVAFRFGTRDVRLNEAARRNRAACLSETGQPLGGQAGSTPSGSLVAEVGETDRG